MTGRRHPVRASRPTIIALVAVLLALLAGAPPAGAQDVGQLDIQIRSAKVLDDGITQVVVDVQGAPPGGLDASMFEVLESNEPQRDLDVRAAIEIPNAQPRIVMVAVDTSGSTRGAPHRRALAAVEAFVREVTTQDVAVGLVQFASVATLLVEPTTELGELLPAIRSMSAQGGTKLYDAITLAAETLAELEGQSSIVVFSDGGDSGGGATEAEALEAVGSTRAPITLVALVTDDFDPAPLEDLAEATNGRVIETSSAADLAGAFRTVARDLDGQYIIEYPATSRTGQFTIEVEVDLGTRRASDEIAVLNTLEFEPAAPPETTVVRAPGPLAREGVLPVLLVLGGLGLAIVLSMLLLPGRDAAIMETLRAALAEADEDESDEMTTATAAVSRQAIQLIERVPKPEGYDERLQAALDRASWPLRSNEFTTLQFLAALVGLMLGLGLLQSIPMAVTGVLLGLVLPRAILSARVNARRKAFMDQLPDTLQLIAGSLKAGYGVLQAIDTVVKETDEPTRSEFQRVLAEARLGLPLEDALVDMAERVDSEDFRWVAVAINIQRRVGGNLAQLLETVSSTLRERQATRRQIQALSAEGRLSAVILVALPFVLAGYMFLVQPDYLGELIFDSLGRLILGGSLVLMVVGILWMRRMIEIDV